MIQTWGSSRGCGTFETVAQGAYSNTHWPGEVCIWFTPQSWADNGFQKHEHEVWFVTHNRERELWIGACLRILTLTCRMNVLLIIPPVTHLVQLIHPGHGSSGHYIWKAQPLIISEKHSLWDDKRNMLIIWRWHFCSTWAPQYSPLYHPKHDDCRPSCKYNW